MARPSTGGDVAILAKLGDMDRKLNVIVANQKKLLDELAGNLPIIPELERAVKASGVIAQSIDRKVPDNKKSKG